MNPVTTGFLLSLSLCLDIGIVNVAMMNSAMQRGYWSGFWLGLGSCLGDLVYALLALLGMTALLSFSAVRWAMWLGGSALLAALALKMVFGALRAARSPALSVEDAAGAAWRQFGKGVLLALSSPSAIVWFAAVGGALIAQSAGRDWGSTGRFLAGFFAAGVLWTVVVCFLARMGGKLFGARALAICYLLSALLFAYFSFQVVTSGYRTLILGQV